MELNKIICGDCIEVMKEIPDGVVDLVVTDPPYFNKPSKPIYSRAGKKDVVADVGSWDVFETDGTYLKFIRKVIREINRVLKPNGSLYLFTNDRYLSYIRHAMKKLGMSYKSTIVWHKYNSPPRFITAGFISSKEFICYAFKGSDPVFNKPKEFKDMLDVWITPQTPSSERCGHPTQKPLFLIERLIELSSNEGMLILDSFVGSGTTVVASEKLNRKWIGIDISENYCNIARRRLEETQRSLDNEGIDF